MQESYYQFLFYKRQTLTMQIINADSEQSAIKIFKKKHKSLDYQEIKKIL